MNKIELFERLVNILDNNNITYAIVGRTEEYPEKIGSDVDIVIPRQMIESFHHAVWSIEDQNTQIVQMFQHEIVAFYYIVFHFDGNNVRCIQPDVCTDYYRKGRKLLTADYLLQGRRLAKQGGFHVLAPEKEFLYYLLKKVDKRNLSKEQFEHIRNSYSKDKIKALEEAKLFWQGESLNIIEKAMDEDDYELLNRNLKSLQNGIHSSHRKSVFDTIQNVLLKVKRVLQPTGFVMAVMGPDGSGKTTVINQFKEDIRPAFRKMQQFHFFPKPSSGINVVTDPQGKKARGLVGSVAKLAYFLVLYNIGHFRYVLPKKIRSTLTIFDRYYDDIIADPLRYRNGTPTWIVKFFGFLIPEPALWIVLDCPTDVIQARKAEVSPEETERQRQAYLKFAKTKKNCLVLNTNRDVKEISAEACKFVCETLNKRSINRYKR